MDFLDDNSLELMSKGFCPACRQRGFVFGPRGGAAMNVECASVACRARFNITLSPVGPPGLIVMAHEIEREASGGPKWTNAPDWGPSLQP